MPRVLICDKLESAGIDLLKKAGIEVDNRPGLTGEALADALHAADAAIVRSATRITAELLESPGKLRAVARAGVGVDNIDVPVATRKGVVVMNTPGGNTISAAEHTIALMMSLARHIPAADASMKAGKWDRGKYVGAQIAGKTLGVVGLGRIGREVARRAVGLDMKVVGYDPFLAPDRAAQLGIQAVSSIDAMLPLCDFLSLHVPMTDETKGIIGPREIDMLPKWARLLNVARGGIIEEQALVDALKSGRIAGAAIDVFTQEPIAADSPLLKAPNIVLTPHLGASTVEAQEAVALEAAQLLIDYLTRGIVQCAVNMAAFNRAELDEMKYFVDLARRLGLLQAQLADGPISKVSLLYRGDLALKSTKLLTAAFAAGLLEFRLAESVNLINAELLARERGIEIVESANPHKGDFSNLLQSEVFTEKKSNIASGTLFGKEFPRLVQMGPYRLESYLDGVMLAFTHHDVPGLIGYIGTVFGKHMVNIASMNVGRQMAGGEAIAVLNLDSPPPEVALKEIKSHDKIYNVTVVKLPPSGEMPVWFG
ncbi:MAG: phosphoglycerate dehydrogenase [Planctomycetes bacterium]|nr:phosphoglycerate dehydrogenase [Planctomycetota bacterium]